MMRDDGRRTDRGPDRTLIQPELRRMIAASVAVVFTVSAVAMIMGAGIENAGRQPVGADHQPVAAGQVGRHESGRTDQLDQHGQHCHIVRSLTPASIGDPDSH